MALERLVESFSCDLTSLKVLPIKESALITEAASGKKYKCIKAYEADVSRFIKNANGRIYTKKLWEKVIKDQKNIWEGSLGLADHPLDEEEGSVRNVFGVWRNLRIDEKSDTVKADLFLVGHYGSLAQDILEAGGRVGFSSSGFGELSEDGSGIVKEDTYMLERVSDWVLHPSQDVWAVKENAIEDENDEQEKVEENSQPAQAHIQENTMDHATATNKMSPKEIRKFKEDIYGWMQKAESITDLQEKLGELTEILSYFSADVAPEMKEEVEKQIADTKAKIDLAIKEHGRIKETFDVTTAEELKEGIKKVAIDTQLFERDATEWKTIAQGLQEKVQKLQSVLAVRPTNEAYKTSLDYSKKLEEKFRKRENELLGILEGAAKEIDKYKALNERMSGELKAIGRKLGESEALSEKYKAKAQTLFNQIKEAKAAQAQTKKIQEAKQADEMSFKVKPHKTPTSMFEGFNESAEVEEYYEDLVGRHGEAITPFEESIKGCKTLKEAMLLYTKILSKMDYASTRKVTEALDPEDRRKLIEGQTGRKIRTQSTFQSRLPSSWE